VHGCVDEDGGTAEPAVGQVGQGLRGVVHRVGGGGGTDPEPLGEEQELLAVAAGVRGDVRSRRSSNSSAA
jgi:hypothetical protein